MSGPDSEGLLPGSKFGVYEIGECIGRGAMGQVYRAEHTMLKRSVALKVMTAAARNSTTGHRRFKREARAAAAIKHPNVVEILDMGVLDGLPFIVMELLEGEDLESLLARQGKLTEQQLVDLALPIIAAIGAVHDAGVVHRDIKPSNIFLAKGGREDPVVPKVLDFGISKAAKPLGDTEFVATGPGDLVGTPLYISPEALKGAQHLTARSDQYSLGVVLYQCALGRRPHEAKDLAKLVRSILSDPITPLRSLDPSISAELEGAVMRALSRDPEQRFEHVRALGAALLSLASQRTRHVWAQRFAVSLRYTQPLGAPPAPAPAAPRRELRPLVAGGAAALAVLAAGYLVSVLPPAQRIRAAVRPEAAILAQQAGALEPAPSVAAPEPSAAVANLAAPTDDAQPAVSPAAPASAERDAAAQQAPATPASAAQPPREGEGSAARERNVQAAAEPPTSRAPARPSAARRAVAAAPSRAAARVTPSTPARAPAAARSPASSSGRAPDDVLDESSLLRGRPSPVEPERAEPPLPRGANQSPILD